MAAVRKNQVKKIRFELTRSAIAGIAVIVFCLFLWMFLLGVWAGQSLLLPAYGKKALVTVEKVKAVESQAVKTEKKTGK
ncbi:MAG: hypothetical protein KJ630_04095 [Proteobacteria bacterium]|nr:hypothetical protein [Pseudomonadota bacterium]